MDKTIERERTFTIYQANGKRKEGLKKAFVEVIALNGTEQQITLTDGSRWPLYFETDIENANLGNNYKHIISFQVYKDGDYFAVARLYKEKGQ